MSEEWRLQSSKLFKDLNNLLDGMESLLALKHSMDATYVTLQQVEAVENRDDYDALPLAPNPAWAGLPLDVLAAILHPQRVGNQARLACKPFRDAYDAGVQRATLHLLAPAVLGRDLLPAPRCARVVRLDASDMHLSNYIEDVKPLATMLEGWNVAVPLRLDLSKNGLGVDPEHVANMLTCPTFAPGGLQALDISHSCLGIMVGMPLLAAALPAAPQLSTLCELVLGNCQMKACDGKMLFDALQVATHIRSLTLLDLSYNHLGDEGVMALAACLCAAPHLASSLQQLMLDGNKIGAGGAAKLAHAVTSCRVKLVQLYLHRNCLGFDGVAAWAEALGSCSHLSGLEVLDFSCDKARGAFVLCDALQAATHLVRLRRLNVLSHDSWPEAAMRFAQLLHAAPHLASVQHLDLQNGDRSGDAALAALRAPLPQLRTLHLAGYGDEGLQRLSTALPGATHLSLLQELFLQPWSGRSKPDSAGARAVDAALAASSHLSGLQQLSLAYDRVHEPLRVSSLLRVAPHLRGLTEVALASEPFGSSRPGLHDALALLPHLRRLAIRFGATNTAEARELGTALQHAPCAPDLQELTIQVCTSSEECEDVACVVALLQGCTRASGLRLLRLADRGMHLQHLEWLGAMLASMPHLAGLQELRLEGALSRGSEVQRLYDMLSDSPLAGVRVLVGGVKPELQFGCCL